MKVTAVVLAITGALLGGASACAVPPAAQPSASSAAPAEAAATALTPKALVANGALAIDVRSQAEYDEGHTSQTKLIPIDDFEPRIGEFAALTGGDKAKPIVVVCRSGGRAGRAKAMLEKAGYTNVTNGGPWQSLKD
jgi:rhodanese-related sulfurtransferase